MFSIERITAKTRKVSIFDAELGQNVDIDVFLWNETVANLTLMALGSSAPEILLAAIEAVRSLSDPPDQASDSLGLFTILGSAAFNLFGIAGVCVLSIPSPAAKRIEKFGVFIFTSICSLFAYFWMLLVTVYISPQVIELWEAILTFAFFPIMVLLAYAQDKGWWIRKKNKTVDKPIQPSLCQNSIQLTVVSIVDYLYHSITTWSFK
ncbi:Sodium/calcium exchanger 2 [Fasciolopsis buskii]|uniref:Sodium/calcium exchanger 2 n=1 Tax=Fasciolopsis buskii TaxID=27845 RepID=A0A8E0RSB9_9TREM|nr:Sodium/calcium exchanger 2 [Fasciolopsis buski]